jgi:gliding motility-associated-like protein
MSKSLYFPVGLTNINLKKHTQHPNQSIMDKKNTKRTQLLKRLYVYLSVLLILCISSAKAQWAAMGTGANDIVYAVSPDVTNTGVYFGESFANVTGGKNFIRYWNGSTISNLNANAYVNGYIYAIAVSGTNIYVGGTFTSANGVAGFNGIACWSTVSNTWSTLGSGMAGSNATVFALTVDPSTNKLYAGGEFLTVNGITVNNVAVWNISSSSWSALNPGTAGVSGLPAGSPPGAKAGVYALTLCNNNLYAGGRFTSVNGATTANNIAAWNGSAWSTLSGGGQTGVSNTTVVNPANVASAVWDAPVMALTNDGKTVYVGGDFNKVNNVTGCNNIAAWNVFSSTWSTMGAGMTWPGSGTTATDNTFGDQANVYALTMYGSNVIAGGDFMKAGTVGGANTSLFVAQWNGSAWSALSTTCGGATESDVFCLTTSNGMLYAGGQFPQDVPNTPANMWYIAEYSGAGPTISVSIPPTNTICAGNSTVINASGAATNYTWSPGTTLSCINCASPTASPTITTTYSVTGIFGGCTATQTVTVFVNPKPTITLTPSSSTLCGSSGTTTITASGANTYTWSPSATLSSSTGTQVTATPTSTTTYTVNATDNNGCTNNKSVTISVSPLPTLTLSASSSAICIGNSSTLSAAGASTYTWAPSASLSASTGASVTANPTVTTNYTVNATSAAGCVNNQTITVTVNPLPTLILTASSAIICAGSTSTLSAVGANTYTWSPAGSLSSSTGTPVTATPASTTTYSVIGTDNNGCKNNQIITLNINPLPILSLTTTSTTICAGSTSTLTASGASTYTWSPASSLSSSNGSPVTAAPPTTTNYTVNATDNNGCTNNATIAINVTPTSTLTIGPSQAYIICKGDFTTMSVSGGNTYTWSPSTTLSSTTSATVTATPTTTTAYTVIGTASGCNAMSATATITVNIPPDVSIHTSSASICIGTSTTLTAVGSSVSYSWSPAAGLSGTTGTPVTASPTITTQYILTGTSANGCTNKDSLTITVNPTPTLSINSSGGGTGQVVCSGTTVNAITFNTAPGNLINWNNTNTSIGIASSGTTDINSYTAPTVTLQQTGIITAVATNTTTGCSSSITSPPAFTVSINPLPIITPTNSLIPGGCGGLANGCISNVAGQSPGTYQYSWDNGATWSANSQHCNIPAGNYVVEVKDANGCISQESISLPTANAPVLPSVNGLPANTCAGDTIHLAVATTQPHMTYTWTSSSGTQTGTTYNVNNVTPAGTYSVGLAVADSNACSNSTSFSFTVNTLPHPVINGNNHFCKGASTVLNVTPVNTIYTYQWSLSGNNISGATTPSYTAIAGGTYGMAVTNTVTGCKHDTLIIIKIDSVPPIPTISTATNNNTYCQGQSINPITVNGTGSFNWYADAGLTTPIGTGSPFTPSVSVTSTVYVTASNSVCTSDSTPVVITINPIPATPSISIGSGNNMYCQNQTVGTIAATGATTIVWYNNSTLTHIVNTGNTYTPTGLPLGTTTYYLIDSSAAGCKSAGTTTVAVTMNANPATPTLVSPSVNVYCQNQTIGTITASGAVTILWYDDATLTNVINTGTSYIPSNLPIGTTTYYLVDSSSAGCKSAGTSTVSITINATPNTPVIAGGNAISYCQGSSVTSINASGTNTLVWYNNAALNSPAINIGNSYTPINLPIGATTYYLIDTSVTGCRSTATTVSVTINPKPVITGTVSIDSSLCGKNNGSVSGLTVGNGTPQYNYQWVNANGNVLGTSPNLTNVGAGTYSLIVIDANQCRDTSSGSGYTVGASNTVTADFTPSTYQGTAPTAVTFSNTSIGASGYFWNFGDNAGTSTQINPAYTYTNAGTYSITLIAFNGHCGDTITKAILIEEPEVLIIPNIFSPNGDAINDQFFITTSGISTLNVDIYNRWGQLVYTIKSVHQSWDGIMNNGNQASEGTYFYLLQATGYDGKEYKRDGPLTLVR